MEIAVFQKTNYRTQLSDRSAIKKTIETVVKFDISVRNPEIRKIKFLENKKKKMFFMTFFR